MTFLLSTPAYLLAVAGLAAAMFASYVVFRRFGDNPFVFAAHGPAEVARRLRLRAATEAGCGLGFAAVGGLTAAHTDRWVVAAVVGVLTGALVLLRFAAARAAWSGARALADLDAALLVAEETTDAPTPPPVPPPPPKADPKLN